MTEIIERLRTALAGRYTVERMLGIGGMATVFMAEDTRHRRPVALKVLRPELSAVLGAERFLKEIEVTAGLQHPHILPLFDSGQADGLLFYVTPYVDGGSLRDRLDREKQLGVDEAVRIASQVAGALDYAHRRHVIHRDIKPENILLLEGEAMLADFGIALAITEAGGSRITETGLSLGTPQYMSPEQATGERDIDGRTDVYALSAVLYEMLAGEPPHTGATGQAVVAKLIASEPVRVGILRPALPAGTEAALHRGLARHPQDRFPTAGAMLEALRKSPDAHEQHSVPAQRHSGPRPRFAGGRARWALGLGLALATVAGGLVWQRSRGSVSVGAAAADARSIAVRYFTSPVGADSLRYLADGLTEELITTLRAVPGLDVLSREAVAQFRDADVSRDSIAAALRIGTLIEGDVEQAGSLIRITIRLVDAGSGAEFQRAAFEVPSGSYQFLSDSLAARAAQFLRQRLGEEVRLRELRVGTGSAEAWVMHQRSLRAWRIAEGATDSGDSVGAARFIAQADSFARDASARDRDWNAPVVHRATMLYRRSRWAVGDPLAARSLIERGVAVIDTVLGRDPDDPDALELRGNLQYWKYLMRLEDPVAAAVLLGRARADLERATRVRPAQAGAWSSLSHLYYNDTATTLVDVALAAHRAYEADPFLSNAAVILSRLFFAYFDLEKATDAGRWCAEGGRRFPDQSEFTLCRIYLMMLRGQEPDPAEAWRLAEDEVLRRDQGPSGQYVRAEARMLVACVLARAGLSDSAKAVANSALLNTELDPTRDLAFHQAACLLLAGDRPGSLRALRDYFAANPDRRREFLPDPGWRFRGLADDPAFIAMVSVR